MSVAETDFAQVTPIGWRHFTDGTMRPVFLDQDGRQFIHDDDGQPASGTWIYPAPDHAFVVQPDLIINPTPCNNVSPRRGDG
jgi:hypothetical protein